MLDNYNSLVPTFANWANLLFLSKSCKLSQNIDSSHSNFHRFTILILIKLRYKIIIFLDTWSEFFTILASVIIIKFAAFSLIYFKANKAHSLHLVGNEQIYSRRFLL